MDRAFSYFTAMAKRHSFGKKEKLKSRKLVDDLFASGKSSNFFPIRMVYKFAPFNEIPGMQVGVTASSRHFKKAVDRNRIKRLLREAYRLQKNDLFHLVTAKKLMGYTFFIYVDKTMPTYQNIFEAMTRCLDFLHKKATTINESAG